MLLQRLRTQEKTAAKSDSVENRQRDEKNSENKLLDRCEVARKCGLPWPWDRQPEIGSALQYRFDRLDVTLRKTRNAKEHRNDRNQANRETGEPDSAARKWETRSQFKIKEQQQKPLREEIVESVIFSEEDAQADKQAARENSARGRFFDQLRGEPDSAKQKCVIEKFVRRKHPYRQHETNGDKHDPSPRDSRCRH